MPVQWEWYDSERKIMRFVFLDPWDGEDFLTANQEASEALNHLDWIVDAIFDLSHSAITPRNLVYGTVYVVRHSQLQTHQGIAVVVGANVGVKILMQVVQQLIPPGILFMADELEGALHIINEQRLNR